MSEVKPKIFVVDTDVEYTARCAKKLEEAGFDVYQANSVNEFEWVLDEHNWSVIVLASELIQHPVLDEGKTITDNLVRMIREHQGEAVKIIANSDNAQYNSLLKKAGCNIRSTSGARFRSFALPNICKGLLQFVGKEMPEGV